MRSTRARRAAMIGTAALLLVAPCVALAQAEPAAPAPGLPAELVAAVQRDLGLSPAQYLEQAEAGQELLRFAETLRGKFPTAFAGVWLDAAGAPLVGLADGPDTAAARTAVEAAGYQVKDQPRSEQVLSGLLGQLNGWVQQLPAPLSGLVNGAAIDPVANDIALEVKDTAGGQGLQLPDFLNFVRVAKVPGGSSELPGFGSLGSSGPATTTAPTKPTEPTTTKPTEPTTTKPTEPTTTKPTEPSKITLDPITAAPDSNEYTLKAKVTPAAAGGTVEFKDGNDILGTTKVEADGTAVRMWYPEADGNHTITAIFSGRDGVAGSTTTAQVTVTTVGNNATTSTTTLDPIKGAAVGKEITLKAKVTPAEAGGTVAFDVTEPNRNMTNEAPVGADGTATLKWTPENAGKATVEATFSGRDGVTGSTTTVQVTVAEAPKPTTTKPTTTTPKPPAPDAIMGGQGYRSGETASDPCSFGFNGTDGAGNAVNITAGHCDFSRGGSPRVFVGGSYVGAFEKVAFEGFDYGLIRIDARNRFENNFVSTYGGAPVRITGTADPVVGAPVCKSGEITGFTCGKITAVDVSMNSGPRGARVPNAFAAKVCSIPGDSGGAIVTGTKALGITAAGSGWDCDPSKQTYAQPINSVLADNPGLKVRTN
ncbi:Ig-like domain repeat protein [Rhodococcus maanshanensis]|uniref:Ig-like domain (Group 3) n=1 Tax=Rhodococcus maanshanensis TaxID=183556 RepID=A0A1H7VIN2_9NOCA|nr:Ig-like domain repeat protein [Rhodococcus maanshanensis]SEM08759.1 Ig-like domain (group 3) [Rhodococcus maanshanensis]